MKITAIRVVNVRNHTDTSLTLSPTTTLITGQNGSGKTSILEAMYITLRGTSFRAVDSEIVREDTEWYRIEAPARTAQARPLF